MNIIWQDFNGNKKEVHELSHAHLSNIIHFITHILSADSGNNTLPVMKLELERRFDGKLLPYTPRMQVEWEILNGKNMLEFSDRSVVIVKNGVIIGSVTTEIYNYIMGEDE